MLSDDDRFAALKEYYPNARKEDWKLIRCGAACTNHQER